MTDEESPKKYAKHKTEIKLPQFIFNDEMSKTFQIVRRKSISMSFSSPNSSIDQK